MQVQIPLLNRIKLSFITFHKTLQPQYNYNKSVFINMATKIEVVCPLHGSFWQTPKLHKSGSGCKECYNIKRKTTNSNLKTFAAKANTVHNNKYTYTNANYKNSRTKLTITCSNHGNFQQTPSAHLQGRGCQQCGKLLSGWSDSKYKDHPVLLYYVKIGKYYKIGITKHQDLRKRFKTDFSQLNIQIIKTWTFPESKDACNLERKCLNATYKWKYTGPKLLKTRGETEMRTKNVIHIIDKIIKEANANV